MKTHKTSRKLLPIRQTGNRHPPWFLSNSLITTARDDRFWVHHPAPGDFLLKVPFYIARSGYSIWKAGKTWEWDKSPVFGIELITRGNLEFAQNGRKHLLQAGDVFVSRPGTAQRFTTGDAGFVHKRYAYFAGPMLEIFLHATGLNRLDCVRGAGARASLSGSIRQCCRLLAGDAGETEKTRELSVLALRIALDVVECTSAGKLPAPVSKAMEFMNRNMRDRMTLRLLARNAGLSAYHFSRLFARHAGSPPLRYLTRRRMEYAAQLLVSTDLLIKEIAVMVGYENPLHFSGVFSKVMGMNPRRYRLAHPSAVAVDEVRRRQDM